MLSVPVIIVVPVIRQMCYTERGNLKNYSYCTVFIPSDREHLLDSSLIEPLGRVSKSK